MRVLAWSGVEPLSARVWWGDASLAQWNVSASAAGVLRGMHLHGRSGEVYLLLEGAMEAAVCDLRDASPSAGQSACFAVAGAGSVVTVPAGVLHGLYFTQPSLLLTGRSAEHNGADEWRCRWDDPALYLTWRPMRPLLSPEDAAAGSVAQLREAAGPLLRRSGAA